MQLSDGLGRRRRAVHAQSESDLVRFTNPHGSPPLAASQSSPSGARATRNQSRHTRIAQPEARMEPFNWHSGPITRATPVTPAYRNTQNVRRFFRAQCGDSFKFDRSFIAWLIDGTAKTMGDAAGEWLRRHPPATPPR
jgi:hypothetical protein